MRQAITTKYLGPTNSRPGRIKAIARKRKQFSDGTTWPELSLTVSYGYRGNEEEHTLAAKGLAKKLGWFGLWVGGGNANEDGYCYVNVADVFPNVLPDGMRPNRENLDWFYIERQTDDR